jgi:hypothetical protein
MPAPPEFKPMVNIFAMIGPLIMPAIASITAVAVYSLAVWFLCTNDAARDCREGSRPEAKVVRRSPNERQKLQKFRERY